MDVERRLTSEQRYWLIGMATALVPIILIAWLHLGSDPRQETQPQTLDTAAVLALISQAIEPLSEQAAEQDRLLDTITAMQERLVSELEQTALDSKLREENTESANVSRAGLQAALRRYEARLDALKAQADDPAVANEIAATKTQINQIEEALGDLSARVDCVNLASSSTSVRTFVVPSRSSLSVPGETIVITIGRYRSDRIDTVSINARAALHEPISTRVISGVPIGGNIEFRHEKQNYVATFTNATGRFLNSALIGIELRSSPVELADCEEAPRV